MKEERSGRGSLLSVPLTPQVTLDKQGAQPSGGGGGGGGFIRKCDNGPASSVLTSLLAGPVTG